jgi:hypothetical protein
LNKSLKMLAVAALLCSANLSFAQGAALPSSAAQASSPAKKELIAKLLVLQQPGIEMLTRNILQQPLAGLMQSAGGALQQVPVDKREAVGKAIEADLKKFFDDNAPMMKERAIKLSPTTIGVVLDERFSEDELKQVLTWLESPVSKKFGQVNGELQKVLTEKLMADVGGTLDTRFKTLQQGVAKQLGVTAPKATAPAPAASASAIKK